MEKKKRKKNIAQPDYDEERIKSDDIIQFKVVSHKPLSNLENLCENVKNNADLSGLKNVDFDKLGRDEKSQVEEALYAIMLKFKKNSLEFSNTIPKFLYDIVE